MASITGELREYTAAIADKGSATFARLGIIADRIDEAHKSALASAYGEGAESVALPDLTGYVKLPVDADGVPIHIGDVTETEDSRILEVDTMQVSSRKWSIGLVNTLDATFSWHDADRLRHHHAPTVEDVLREFAERYLDYEGVPSAGRRGIGEALMDEYAAKLRLASDAE